MMFRYSLTGHTQGLGLELKNVLPDNTLCFSRSNNYDISKRSDRKNIIKESIDCDVFISNAYDKFSQVDLLLELVEQWKDKNKVIINIGSNITNYKPESFNYNRLIHKSHKTSLLNTVNEINNYDMKLKVVYFNIVGYLGTPKMKEKYPSISNFLSTRKIANDIIEATQPSSKD